MNRVREIVNGTSRCSRKIAQTIKYFVWIAKVIVWFIFDLKYHQKLNILSNKCYLFNIPWYKAKSSMDKWIITYVPNKQTHKQQTNETKIAVSPKQSHKENNTIDH